MNTDIAIIGSGFSGLGMATRLKQAGRHDFAVDERSGEVGGTWEVNTYPGCACDIPSHLYSFSFAPTPIGRRPTPSSRRSGRARGGTIEVRPEAQERLNAALDRRLPGSVWSTGCASWYLDETGRNATQWPDWTWRFRRRAARLDPAEYALRTAS